MAPYYISDSADGCAGWATVKDDGEVMGCHTSKQDAIDQGLAIAQAEGSTFEGERSEQRDLPDNYRPALSEDVPEGRACGNCIFYDETRVSEDGTQAWCQRWDEFVDGGFYCNAWEPDDEERQVNLVAPSYMRAAARQGLRYYDEGLAGDGLVDRTVTEARQMARGDSLTPDKWVRIAAWIARHLVDLDAPGANPESDQYPTPGVVAHLLWGSGPSKRSARRAMEYAEGVVARLEAENEGRAKGLAVKKLETRIRPVDFEIRELEDGGLHFEGYAAVFNSRSEDLGGFTEVVAPGAFKRSLQSRNDVKLLFDHNPANVLASTRAGTMTLTEDARGLKVVASLAPTTLGRDISVLIKRGDIDSMSFGFSVIRDSWNDNGTERTLNSVRIMEASIVSWPAYKGTAGTVSVRGLDRLAKRADVDADQLADALMKLEEGADMSADEVNLLSQVIDKLKPQDDSVDAEAPAADEVDLLALKKKKLQLLEMLNG